MLNTMEVRKVFVVSLWLMSSGRSCAAMDFWEFAFGPRLGGGGRGSDPGHSRTTERLVKSHGYRLDTHQVASETGHILTLHRIPRGTRPGNSSRPIALLHHGLLGCSDIWLARGPQDDLAFLLADAGYDVWLFNARGSVYSRRHKKLDPDHDAAYWDWGVEEMGYYDLAVSVDYVLNITGRRDLFYLGYSLGASTCFVLCSMRPEYNEKIRLFVGLGPLAAIRHAFNPVHKVFFSLAPRLIHYLVAENIHEVLPRRLYFNKLLQILCQDGAPTQNLCVTFIFLLAGDDIGQFNSTVFSNFMRYFPAGTSARLMLNLIQYYLTGNFARFDHGNRMMNILHYNSSAPPNYDLSKVTAPVALYSGQGDFLVNEKDVGELASRLPNVVGKFPVPHKNFNHFDFILANDVRTLLYDSVIKLMDRYK